MKSLVVQIAFLGSLAAALVVGCAGKDPDLPFVSLESPLETDTPAVTEHEVPYRIGVASIFAPVTAFQQFAGTMTYLAEAIDRPVDMVQRPTYFEINEMVRAGDLHCAFICSGAYVLNSEGLEVLVTPVIHGRQEYGAVCVVSAVNPAGHLEDLEGASFALTDPLSFTGRAYVARRLAGLGSTPDDFFSRTLQVEGHDTALHLVAAGSVDGGCVNSMVHERVQALEPSLTQQVRVFEESPMYGAPPVVVSATLPEAEKSALLRAFERMEEDPGGLVAIEQLGVERFEAPAADLYASLSAWLARPEPEP